MITIVMILTVVVVLAAYYCWSMATSAAIMQCVVLQAEEVTTATIASNCWKSFSRKGVKQYLRQALLEEELDGISLPRKSNHLFSEATCGEWGKIGVSHYGKGVTLRDYRRGTHLSKKVLHPCMGGDKYDACYD